MFTLTMIKMTNVRKRRHDKKNMHRYLSSLLVKITRDRSFPAIYGNKFKIILQIITQRNDKSLEHGASLPNSKVVRVSE
jgi:hypothetical protein